MAKPAGRGPTTGASGYVKSKPVCDFASRSPTGEPGKRRTCTLQRVSRQGLQ